MDVSVVVFTGGPCAGKSTILPIAKQWLEDRGCQVAVLSESATELITAGFNPVESWPTPYEFQSQLLLHQAAREERYIEMLRRSTSETRKVLLCDRGALDGVAYVGRHALDIAAATKGLALDTLIQRYDLVIHLVSAACGAASFYTTANNAARMETVEEAAVVDGKTQTAWLGHPHFTVIDNSTDFVGKVRRALRALARKLHLPEPLEVERKFLVHAMGALPEPTVRVDITQTYLRRIDPAIERRVRRRAINNVLSYFYTEKRQTDDPSARVEHERILTVEEYEVLLTERDLQLQTIEKTRYCFVYAGRQLELDVYRNPVPGLIVLEAEGALPTDEILLPPQWQIEEVTGNRDYSNATLARR
jgi:CYTH domain-containing protein/thymidylate kinase